MSEIGIYQELATQITKKQIVFIQQFGTYEEVVVNGRRRKVERQRSRRKRKAPINVRRRCIVTEVRPVSVKVRECTIITAKNG